MRIFLRGDERGGGAAHPKGGGQRGVRVHSHVLIVKLPEDFSLEEVRVAVLPAQDGVDIRWHALPHKHVAGVVRLNVEHVRVDVLQPGKQSD